MKLGERIANVLGVAKDDLALGVKDLTADELHEVMCQARVIERLVLHELWRRAAPKKDA